MTTRSEEVKAELKEAKVEMKKVESQQEQVEQKLEETKKANPVNTAEIQRLEQTLQRMRTELELRCTPL